MTAQLNTDFAAGTIQFRDELEGTGIFIARVGSQVTVQLSSPDGSAGQNLEPADARRIAHALTVAADMTEGKQPNQWEPAHYTQTYREVGVQLPNGNQVWPSTGGFRLGDLLTMQQREQYLIRRHDAAQLLGERLHEPVVFLKRDILIADHAANIAEVEPRETVYRLGDGPEA